MYFDVEAAHIQIASHPQSSAGNVAQACGHGHQGAVTVRENAGWVRRRTSRLSCLGGLVVRKQCQMLAQLRRIQTDYPIFAFHTIRSLSWTFEGTSKFKCAKKSLRYLPPDGWDVFGVLILIYLWSVRWVYLLISPIHFLFKFNLAFCLTFSRVVTKQKVSVDKQLI